METTVSLLLLSVCLAFAIVQAENDDIFPLAIISSPTSKLVSINEQDGVTFHCTVKGESLEWVINDEYPSISRNDRLIENGVEFTNCPRINGVINCSITFPSTLYFNMTRLRCGTQNLTMVMTSEEVIMIIAGPPLAPSPQLNVLSTTHLQVSWSEPFTWEAFPILDYIVTVYNTSDQTRTAYTVTETMINITQDTEMMVCSELQIDISARSHVGNSSVESVTGGFPVVPSEFPTIPRVTVRFLADATPEVKIFIMTPDVCSFQEAYYQVKVYRAGSNEEPVAEGGLIDNTVSVVEAEFLSLNANVHYYAVITYTTMSKIIFANISFSTAFQPTAPVTTDENATPTTEDKPTEAKPTEDTPTTEDKPTEAKPTEDTPTTDDRTLSSSLEDEEDNSNNKHFVTVISSAVSGCLVIATIIVIIVLIIIILLRRQLILKSKEERENRNAMVQNPLYEGPIYEIISENKKLKSLVPKTKLHAEESLYLDSPTQSMPRDCVPTYHGSMVIVNTEGKQMTTVKLEGACGVDTVESNLDQHKLQSSDPYTITTAVDSEDAYTIMCPVLPNTTNGIIPDHTNYQAASNGQSVCEQHVMGTSMPIINGDTSPFTSGSAPYTTNPFTIGSAQKQVTLV